MTFARARSKLRPLPRIAVVGCGAAAKEFCLPVLARYPNAGSSVVLVDKVLSRATALAREFGLQHSCTDYDSLPIDVDAALITTPHNLHARQASHFLRRGQHVFVEKPLGMTEAEVAQMLAAAASGNATLMVNNYRRLFPAYRKVCELVRSRHLGEIQRLTVHDGTQFAWTSLSSFYLRDAAVKGVLLDRGAHTVDVICWWLQGQPRTVAARTDAAGGVEAVMDVELAFHETSIHLKFSRLYRLQNCYTIECEEGLIQGRLFDTSRFHVVRQGRSEPVAAGKPLSYRDCAWQLVQNFVEVVQGQEEPLFLAEDIAPSIAVIERSYHQATPSSAPWYANDPNLASIREHLAATKDNPR